MNFPTSGGIGEISGDQKKERVCYQLSIQRGTSLRTPPRRKRAGEAQTTIMKVVQETMKIVQETTRDNDPKD
ncbi:hypothetical protein LIER_04853 [Lithospermum erythrorhizon]|uniref:Uncharacterized protein n=1 Tax=Lithospermum erythrorhizon TaxID=34254 RepID=A0AAV3P2W8_LITER